MSAFATSGPRFHDFDLWDDGDGVVPFCSCGWEGKRQVDAHEAVDEWENHCDVVFMESTRPPKEDES